MGGSVLGVCLTSLGCVVAVYVVLVLVQINFGTLSYIIYVGNLLT